MKHYTWKRFRHRLKAAAWRSATGSGFTGGRKGEQDANKALWDAVKKQNKKDIESLLKVSDPWAGSDRAVRWAAETGNPDTLLALLPFYIGNLEPIENALLANSEPMVRALLKRVSDKVTWFDVMTTFRHNNTCAHMWATLAELAPQELWETGLLEAAAKTGSSDVMLVALHYCPKNAEEFRSQDAQALISHGDGRVLDQVAVKCSAPALVSVLQYLAWSETETAHLSKIVCVLQSRLEEKHLQMVLDYILLHEVLRHHERGVERMLAAGASADQVAGICIEGQSSKIPKGMDPVVAEMILCDPRNMFSDAVDQNRCFIPERVGPAVDLLTSSLSITALEKLSGRRPDVVRHSLTLSAWRERNHLMAAVEDDLQHNWRQSERPKRRM